MAELLISRSDDTKHSDGADVAVTNRRRGANVRSCCRLALIACVAILSAHVTAPVAQASVDYEWLLTGEPTEAWQPPMNTSATSSGDASGYPVVNLYDNSGMSGASYPQDTHDTVGSNMWMSPAYAAGDTSYKWVQLDLGEPQALGKMLIWNFNEFANGVSYNGRGVRYCYIGYSNDGVNFTWLDGGRGYGGLFELAKAPAAQAPFGATNRTTGSLVDFKGAPGRYVRIWVTSNWGGAAGDGTNVIFGLGEVRIYRYASNVLATGNFIAAKNLGYSSAGYYGGEATTNNLGMSDAGTGTYGTAATIDTGAGWWSEANDTGRYLVYDLGGTYPLKDLYVWNFNGHYYVPLWGRGIKNAHIYYSLDNQDFSWTLLPGPNMDQSFTFAPAASVAGQGYTDVFHFNGAAVRYVKIVANEGLGNGNWGGAYGDTGAYYALGQVRFYAGTGTVAEPSPRWTGITGQRSATTIDWSGADGGYSIPYNFTQNGTVYYRSFFTYADTFKDRWNPRTYARVGFGFLRNTSAIWSGGSTLSPYVSSMAFNTVQTFTPTGFPTACGTPDTPCNEIVNECQNSCDNSLGSCLAACDNYACSINCYAADNGCRSACNFRQPLYWPMGGIFLTPAQHALGGTKGKIFILADRNLQVAGGLVRRGSSIISVNVDRADAPIGIDWSSVTKMETGMYYYDEATKTDYSFGFSIYLDRVTSGSTDYLYIYGTKAVQDTSYLFKIRRYAVVARVQAGSLTNFASWTFYNGSTWVTGMTNAAPIGSSTGNDGLTTSVTDAFDTAHAGQVMMTTMENTLGALRVSYADNPWGPFNTWQTIYAPPERNADTYNNGVWSYIATNHPELAPSSEALISYSVNELYRDPNVEQIPYNNNSDVYHPRFIRVRNIP